MALIVAALAIAVVAALMAYNEQNNPDLPPRPTSPAGSQELADVTDALEREGLEVATLPRTVRSPLLDLPGQAVTVEGVPAYVFIFATVEDRLARTDAAVADPGSVLPARNPFGTPVAEPGAEVAIVGHSNVMVAVVDGSAEVVERVTRAVTGLV